MRGKMHSFIPFTGTRAKHANMEDSVPTSFDHVLGRISSTTVQVFSQPVQPPVLTFSNTKARKGNQKRAEGRVAWSASQVKRTRLLGRTRVPEFVAHPNAKSLPQIWLGCATNSGTRVGRNQSRRVS